MVRNLFKKLQEEKERDPRRDGKVQGESGRDCEGLGSTESVDGQRVAEEKRERRTCLTKCHHFAANELSNGVMREVKRERGRRFEAIS